MWAVHWGLLLRLPWRTRVCPCEGQVWRWQLLELEGFWQHQVLRGVGGYGSRKYSTLEGYGNQYWPIRSSILAWTPPSLTEKPGSPVYRVAKSRTQLKWTCVHRRKTFFACGSSAPVRVEHEGGITACLVGTLAVPRVREHGLPRPQELWPYQSLFSSLLQLAIRRPLWPVFLCSSTHWGT